MISVVGQLSELVSGEDQTSADFSLSETEVSEKIDFNKERKKYEKF